MINLLLVSFPVLAAVAWVIFNIQKPAREQWERQFGDNNKAF